MMSWSLLDMTGEILDNLNSLYVPMYPDRSNDELSETCGKLQEIQKKQKAESDIEIHNPEDQMIKLRLKTRLNLFF